MSGTGMSGPFKGIDPKDLVAPPPTISRVPNKPKTPVTGFRIPQDVKAAASARAEAEGRTLTDVVVAALKRYGKGAK